MAGKAEFDEGAKIGRWRDGLQNSAKALNAIGIMMVSESQRAFQEQRFGNDAWQPRSVPNIFGLLQDFADGRDEPKPRRFDARPALEDTGRLRMSIAHRVLNKSTVEVGSNLPYAQVHHAGGETKSVKITQDLQDRLWKWLKSQGVDLRVRLGWLLNKKWRGSSLDGKVPRRPIVGLTKQTIDDVRDVIGVKIFEVR